MYGYNGRRKLAKTLTILKVNWSYRYTILSYGIFYFCWKYLHWLLSITDNDSYVTKSIWINETIGPINWTSNNNYLEIGTLYIHTFIYSQINTEFGKYLQIYAYYHYFSNCWLKSNQVAKFVDSTGVTISLLILSKYIFLELGRWTCRLFIQLILELELNKKIYLIFEQLICMYISNQAETVSNQD